MKNKHRILLGICLTLVLGIALATSTTLSATSDVEIYAFDQNPAGSDEGNEWVSFHNPSNESVDIGNWTFESTHGTTVSEWIPEGTTLYPGAYCTYTPHYGWLDNSEEAIILRNAKGEEVDRTLVVSDTENDNRYWMRNNSEWAFGVRALEKGKLWSGYVKNVVDGDTIDVCFNIYGIQRVRLVGINAPEIGEDGYEEAKEFVNKTCWGEAIKLDVDDKKQYDPHYRILAVVYVNETNLNEKLVKEGYAEIMYIEVWWPLLVQKMIGHYQYYGISGNIRGLQSFYDHTEKLAFKWINRRSQKKSYNWSQFNRFLSFNPLPKQKIYHFYALSYNRGCTPEEPDEGKPQVRFCEGAHSNPGANTPIGGGLWPYSTRNNRPQG